MGLRDHYIAPKPTFRDATLTEILKEINARGSFTASILATGDGLPIVMVPPDYDGQTISAMAALVQGTVQRALSQMGLSALDEVTTLDQHSMRLVCRFFPAAGAQLILAVIVPSGREYRRLTDEAIRRVLDVWPALPTSSIPAREWNDTPGAAESPVTVRGAG